MKRPTGFTILSLFLGWLAIAGFANIMIQLKSAHGSKLMAILAFCYGATAITSAFGLWKLKSWAYGSFLAWTIVVVTILFTLQFGLYGMFRAPLLLFLCFTVFILVLLTLLARYIKKNLQAISQ